MSSEFERWHGKIALVTGASSGIGAAIAVMLAGLGFRVGLVGRDRSRLRKTAGAIRRQGGESLVLAGDQTRLAFNRACFTRVRRRWGSVDVLVNCAGARGGNSLLAADWAEIDEAFDLNVRAALVCMQEAAAAMKGKRDAAIINISSMTGHRVVPGTPAVYAGTKHMLRILTDGLRTELVREKIKVALISPGLVDTPWHRRKGGLLRTQAAYPYLPLQPDDVAAAVRYILSTPSRVQVRDILLTASGQPF